MICRGLICGLIYMLLAKREVKMAGYCPSSLFFSACLWTELRSIKTQKKNQAIIPPSMTVNNSARVTGNPERARY